MVGEYDVAIIAASDLSKSSSVYGSDASAEMCTGSKGSADGGTDSGVCDSGLMYVIMISSGTGYVADGEYST